MVRRAFGVRAGRVGWGWSALLLLALLLPPFNPSASPTVRADAAGAGQAGSALAGQALATATSTATAARAATATATVGATGGLATTVRAGAAGAALGNLRFIPPVRVVDTRPAPFGPIGFQAGGQAIAVGQLADGSITRFKLAGQIFGVTAIPPEATGVLVNVTVVQAAASGGFVTVYPGDAASAPNASTVNPATAIAANFWSVGLAPAGDPAAGTLAVRSVGGPRDLLIDLVGYYSPSVPASGAGSVGPLRFIPPVRVVDTRPTAGSVVTTGYDGTTGNAIAAGPLTAGSLRAFRLGGKTFGAGAGQVSFPADTSGILAHVTIVQGAASGGFTTLLPGDALGTPGTSTVNPATAIAFNSWAVGVAANGNVGVYTTNSGQDVLIDVVGYWSPSNPAQGAGAVGDLTFVTPVRVVETRAEFGPIGFDGATGNPIPAGGFAPGPSGQTRRFRVGGKTFGATTFPSDITGLLANVTIVQGQASGGFVTMFPGDVADANRPNVSTVNPATAIAASFWGTGIAPSGSDAGNVAVFSTNALDLIVDVVGYFRATPASVTPTATATPTATTPAGGPTPTATATATSTTTPPVLVPCPLPGGVATNFAAANSCLYQGGSPLQTGVAPNTIDPRRAAILRGRVLDANGQPLPLVAVTVLNHPELGQTLTRADGQYDLTVNGGGSLTLNYSRAGLLPAQRTARVVPWQDYTGLDDVVLIPADSAVSAIDLTSSQPIQVARGSTVTDADGSRRPTVFFPRGVTASMTLANGSTQPISPTLHVRATEYTVGGLGAARMPADLPPTSAYTHAVEFSVDEALAAGAVSVQFSAPLPQYVENFLSFPVGTLIPVGSYDRTRGVWVAEATGVVVKIVSVTNGQADLDVDTIDGADPGQYATLGISDDERAALATLYPVNQTLWRYALPHFSPYDGNWPFLNTPPPPNQAGATGGASAPDRPCKVPGASTVGCETQTLGEALPLAGVPFGLNYQSDRQLGHAAARTLTIPLSGATVPTATKRITLEIQVAGRVFTQAFPPTPNLRYTFTWDGHDAYGRTVLGTQPVDYSIGYVYDGSYQHGGQFGDNGNGVPLAGNPTRRETVAVQRQHAEVTNLDARQHASLGGWTPQVHHFYDPNGHVLYLGDGETRALRDIGGVLDLPYGKLSLPGSNLSAWDVGPDGALYYQLTNFSGFPSLFHRIYRRSLAGVVTPIGGSTNPGFSGDGGPALSAQLQAADIFAADDGSVYFTQVNPNTANGLRLRRIDPAGVITTVVGTGAVGTSPDGTLATAAALPAGVRGLKPRLSADGSLYFQEAGNPQACIRRVDPNGRLHTVACQTGSYGGNGGQLAQAGIVAIRDYDLGADGSVYWVDQFFDVRRVWPDGTVTAVAGGGATFGNEGGVATDTLFGAIYQLTVARDGTLFFNEQCDFGSACSSGYRVRRVTPDGRISTAAGQTVFQQPFTPQAEGAVSTAIDLNLLTLDTRARMAGPDGSLFFQAAQGASPNQSQEIWRVQPALPRFTGGALRIAADDGTEVYEFDQYGRHLDTRHALTGAVLWQFAYDGAGRLTTVTDGDGNVTTIQRNGAGTPTAILSPFGQTTLLTLDGNGYLSGVTDAANRTWTLANTAGGLLQTLTDPRGQLHSHTFDTLGRLTLDQFPGSGSWALSRIEAGQTYTTTVTSALNHATTHSVDNQLTGAIVRSVRSPANLVNTATTQPNGTSRLTTAAGMVGGGTTSADPRFGMQAPVASQTAFTSPLGVVLNLSITRTATLAQPLDVFSLTRFTETASLNGRTGRSVFDPATRTFTSTSAFGRGATATIDPQGRLLQSTLPNLNPLNFTYDGRGRIGTISQGSGPSARTTTLGYGPAGFIASLTDALGRTWSYTRDAIGRLTQIARPDTATVALGYDANSNLTSLTPPGRPAHTFSYDARDLLTAYTPPNVGAGTNSTLYTYNADRQLTQLSRPDGVTVAIGYDPAGRLGGLVLPRGTITYGYDVTTGNLSSITAPGSVGLSFGYDGTLPTTESWTGPVTGSLTRVFDTDLRVASDTVAGSGVISYGYDADSLLTTAGALTVSRDPLNGLPNGTTLGNVTTTQTYNGFGEADTTTASYNASPIYGEQNTYDALGRVLTRVETLGATDTYSYTYDAVGRLATLQQNATPTASYAYDANGNRTVMTTTLGVTTAAYDNQDRLTSQTIGATTTTYTYRAGGELASKTTGAQTTTYSYDELGNLLSVTLPSATTVSYTVDGANRRIGRQVTGNPTATRGWLYDDQYRLVAELDASNNVVSRFVWGSRVNVPEYMVKSGTTYRLVADRLGSVRLVVDVATGTVAQQLSYDDWGNVLSDSNAGFQPFGFAGGRYDPFTGLVRFGARDYDPSVGRWTAKDPAGLEPSHPNLYVYALNDPINRIDLTGLDDTIPAQTPEGMNLQGQEQYAGDLSWKDRVNLEKDIERAAKQLDNDNLYKEVRREGPNLQRQIQQRYRMTRFLQSTGRIPNCPIYPTSGVGVSLAEFGLALGEFATFIAPAVAIAPLLPDAYEAARRVGQDVGATPEGQLLNKLAYGYVTGDYSSFAHR